MRKPLCLLLILLLLSGCAKTAGPVEPAQPSKEIAQEPSEDVTPSAVPEPSQEPTPAPSPSPTLVLTPEPVVEPEPEPTEAECLLSQMSLEEKVGQMFLAHWPGGDAEKTASEYHLGGYLFFGSYFEPRNMESAAAGIEEIQNQQNIPMFMAVDEEGGYVNRVSYYPQYRDSIFASGRKLFNLGGIELIASEAKERAALLSKLGLNMNMAPVCDLSGDPGDFIYYRSYGDDPQHVSDCVTAVVEASVSGYVAPVLKHFPGYGPNGDTHTDVVTDERDFESFVNADFLPFLAGIDAGAKCVMVCHNVVSCMDETLPASLSPEVHRVLRENLGFTGVIITDDVSMSAITKFTDGAEAAVLAVEAGNDLICCSDFKTQISAVINAVNEGRISEERINESVLRILELKLDLGIITWGED